MNKKRSQISRRARTGGSSCGAFTSTHLDQKASIIVTLDGILLALTASFLGTALSHLFPLIASTLLDRAQSSFSSRLGPGPGRLGNLFLPQKYPLSPAQKKPPPPTY